MREPVSYEDKRAEPPPGPVRTRGAPDYDALDRVLRGFTAMLARGYQVGDVLEALADGVTEVLGVVGAGVSLSGGDRVGFATACGEAATLIEQLQDEAQAGPGVDALHGGMVVQASLVDEHGRWPLLRRSARRLGVVAAVGIPLQVDGETVGSLSVYCEAAEDMRRDGLRAARLLAATASGMLANAAQMDEIRLRSEQLQEALDSRVVIEQAKGMLAEAMGVSVDTAFTLLREHARANNATLRSVAEAVVGLGPRR